MCHGIYVFKKLIDHPKEYYYSADFRARKTGEERIAIEQMVVPEVNSDFNPGCVADPFSNCYVRSCDTEKNGTGVLQIGC